MEIRKLRHTNATINSFPLDLSSPPRTPEQEGLTTVDDVMVKDPFCETYFPKRDGIKKVIGGQTYYFCSIECRDKYLEAIKDSKQ